MTEKGQQRIRSTVKQQTMLLTFMNTHRNFARGEMNSNMGRQSHNNLWARLGAKLNECGPQKTVASWKVMWKDMRCRARKKQTEIQKELETTGNARLAPELTAVELKVLAILRLDSFGGRRGIKQENEPATIYVSPPPGAYCKELIDDIAVELSEEETDSLPAPRPSREPQTSNLPRKKKLTVPSPTLGDAMERYLTVAAGMTEGLMAIADSIKQGNKAVELQQQTIQLQQQQIQQQQQAIQLQQQQMQQQQQAIHQLQERIQGQQEVHNATVIPLLRELVDGTNSQAEERRVLNNHLDQMVACMAMACK